MKLFCLLVGHEWLTPSWESYELWEQCARCQTTRKVTSSESFFAHLGIRFLIALPPSVSVSLLEDKLAKRRDGGFARAWLTGLGLWGDQGHEEDLQSEAIPEAWLPWVRFALTELVPRDTLDPERIEKFFSTFARKAALPFLIEKENSGFCLLGEPIEEKILETKELSLARRKQFMHGNWQDAAECSDEIIDTYKIETVQAQYQPKRPIAAGALKALRRLRDKEPTLQSTIDPTLFVSDLPLPVEQEFTRRVWVKSVERPALAHC